MSVGFNVPLRTASASSALAGTQMRPSLRNDSDINVSLLW